MRVRLLSVICLLSVLCCTDLYKGFPSTTLFFRCLVLFCGTTKWKESDWNCLVMWFKLCFRLQKSSSPPDQILRAGLQPAEGGVYKGEHQHAQFYRDRKLELRWISVELDLMFLSVNMFFSEVLFKCFNISINPTAAVTVRNKCVLVSFLQNQHLPQTLMILTPGLCYCLCGPAGRPQWSQFPDSVRQHWANTEGGWRRGS